MDGSAKQPVSNMQRKNDHCQYAANRRFRFGDDCGGGTPTLLMRIECGKRAGAGNLIPGQADHSIEQGQRYYADTKPKKQQHNN